MRPDLRKGRRRQMQLGCWIVTRSDSEPQQCQLNEISGRGAKITLPDANKVPASFILLLTEDGKAAHKCAVVWRSDNEVGLRFLGKAAWPPEEPTEAIPLDV
jgi:hypothetical protein